MLIVNAFISFLIYILVKRKKRMLVFSNIVYIILAILILLYFILLEFKLLNIKQSASVARPHAYYQYSIDKLVLAFAILSFIFRAAAIISIFMLIHYNRIIEARIMAEVSEAMISRGSITGEALDNQSYNIINAQSQRGSRGSIENSVNNNTECPYIKQNNRSLESFNRRKSEITERKEPIRSDSVISTNKFNSEDYYKKVIKDETVKPAPVNNGDDLFQ